jgi:hypothetical protein
MTSCGFSPAEIDEMTLFDVHALFAYWRDFPPVHEILKAVHGISTTRRSNPSDSVSDPSGIGPLIARFPDGKVHTG